MKPIRLVIAGVAGIAGIAALMLSSRAPQPTQVVENGASAETQITEILAAKAEISVGTALSAKDFHWVKWPSELATGALILRSSRPGAVEELNGAIVRHAFYPNEPIREEKLIRGTNAGFLSAILPSGKRAVAISIDSRGATSAGGFILPNDRVDVLNTRRDEEASTKVGHDVYATATLLANIRVLAIGQNIQEKNGEKVVVGETATLELDPSQAEIITLNQRTGSLALALRSMADANKTEVKRVEPTSNAVTIVRFGVAQEITSK
jgi:pilus assembly protein CpaB